MVVRIKILSFLALAEKHHNLSVSPHTGLLSEIDQHLITLHIMAYYGMFD